MGTYHLLLVLMGAGGEQQAVQAGAEVASTEQVDGSGMAANSRGSTSGSEQPPRDSDLGLLRSLLDVAGEGLGAVYKLCTGVCWTAGGKG